MRSLFRRGWLTVEVVERKAFRRRCREQGLLFPPSQCAQPAPRTRLLWRFWKCNRLCRCGRLDDLAQGRRCGGRTVDCTSRPVFLDKAQVASFIFRRRLIVVIGNVKDPRIVILVAWEYIRSPSRAQHRCKARSPREATARGASSVGAGRLSSQHEAVRRRRSGSNDMFIMPPESRRHK